MKKLLLLLFMILSLTALAQQNAALVQIDITVVDENGESLPGATVKASDKQLGVVSDINGKVSLWAAKGSTLTISYVGMKTRTLRVSKPLTGDIALENESTTIDQVVVTGYSQTDIRKSTGSVGILTEKELKDQPLANVDMLMQGKLAGVNVQAVSGRPGESAKIRIRGTSSITGNNEPLWVVDGVPLQKNIPAMGNSYIRSGDFSTLYANGVAGIAPQNIESITVLKDAAAAAIYGSQAQAGVIVITTKKGQAGNIHLSYSGNVTVQTSPQRDHNLMNTEEKLAYEQSIWDEFSAAGFKNGTWYPRIGIIGQIRSGYGKFAGMSTEEQDAYIEELKQTNTDWFQELFRNTVSTSHSVSLSGGSDKMTYYVSGSMSTNKGIVKKSSADGANFMSKLSLTPSKAISMNFDVSYSYNKSLSASNSFDMFNYAYFANPYEKPYNDDGSYRADDTFFSMAQVNGDISHILPPIGVNVFREMDETEQIATSSSMTLRGDITWRLGEHFRLYGLASFTNSNDHSDNEVGQDTYTAWQDRPFEGVNILSKRIYGNMTQTANYNRAWQVRAQLNYGQTFNEIHRVSALVGTEVSNNYAKSIYRKVYGYDPVTGNHSLPVLNVTADKVDETDLQSYKYIVDRLTGQSRTENAFASFYGAVDYVLMNRYVANFTARTDGSNNFGAKEQFNMTWSAGLAWNMDEERWMQRIKHIVSHATIRLSTGVTGGVNKSVYPVLIMYYTGMYRNSDTQAYRMGRIQNAPNDHLRWERTRDYNGSIDVGFLKNRLNMNLSFYRRNGYDLVTAVRVVRTTGFSTQSFNTSEQVNQGVELMLGGTPVKTKDWRWSLNGNIAYNQNVLTKYESPTGSFMGDNYVDYPLGKIFSSKPAGINPETGLYTFEPRSDADGDPTNWKNYIYYIGTSNYPWTGGVSTNVSWRNLSLSVNTAFSLGAKISNHVSAVSAYGDIFRTSPNFIANANYDVYQAHNNMVKDAAYRWTPDNPVTDGYPRLIDAHGTALNLNQEQINSSMVHNGVFYENGSYWKISAMTLTYSLPDQLVHRMGMSSLGLNFTANNLWTITAYSGLSPETPGAVYPLSRSFSFGLNIGF
ncbi:MAG: SusC/RagA family TonB-linked outer membrane protein [Prevotella sp.]|nr:SusC/RagA family TonB-linked outer membrane protein [Prevotella sp.]MBQ8487995.1 SusC/RagA family TonB-linked outer membrane protein [Prevotella sp.]